MATAQHVFILLRSLFHLDNLVLVVRQVELTPETEILANLVVVAERHFPTPRLCLTGIGVRHCETNGGRNGVVANKNVGTVLTIVVECSPNLVIEEVDVESIVLLEGLLPTDVGVVLGRLIGSCDTRSSRNCSRLRITEEVAVSVGVRQRQTVCDKSIGTCDIRVGKIHEADCINGFVITYETP